MVYIMEGRLRRLATEAGDQEGREAGSGQGGGNHGSFMGPADHTHQAECVPHNSPMTKRWLVANDRIDCH